MFLGFSRSGHSLVGALLDAHPNMIIAHELDVLKYIHTHFNKQQIYYLLLRRSQAFAAKGCQSGKYAYVVPNQWQGSYETLRIIGDKKGEGATRRLQASPWLLQRLLNTIPERLKVIQVVRNPYDNIASISKMYGWHLRQSAEHYFSLCETVATVQKRIPKNDLFELKHEAFVANPRAALQALCHFLGVEASDAYYTDCASIVTQSPHRTRQRVQWEPELIDLIQARMKPFPFLQGYTYAD